MENLWGEESFVVDDWPLTNRKTQKYWETEWKCTGRAEAHSLTANKHTPAQHRCSSLYSQRNGGRVQRGKYCVLQSAGVCSVNAFNLCRFHFFMGLKNSLSENKTAWLGIKTSGCCMHISEWKQNRYFTAVSVPSWLEMKQKVCDSEDELLP